MLDELGAPRETDDLLRRQTHKLMDAAGLRKVRPYDAQLACLTCLSVNGVPDTIVGA